MQVCAITKVLVIQKCIIKLSTQWTHEHSYMRPCIYEASSLSNNIHYKIF